MRQFVERAIVCALLVSAAAGGAHAAEVFKAPSDGGPRLFEVTGVKGSVNMRAEQSTGSEVVARLRLGARLNNLGCVAAGDMVWCDVQPLAGGPRGYVSADYLTPAKGPDGAVAMGEDDSALRLGEGKFDAQGQVPCAASKGQPMGQCDFKVARGTGGYATIEIVHPGGLKRVIFFADGMAIGFSSSEADGSSSLLLTAEKDDDLNRIRIGDERYEIPDAAVLGG